MSETEQARAQVVASTLVKPSEQIGQNVLSALDQPDTVAVLTTLVPGVQADRVVSLPLSPRELGEVQALLATLIPEEPLAEEDMPCVGFHCEMQRPADED